MKKIAILLIMFLGATCLPAQEKETTEKKEDTEKLSKAERISERIQLTPEEKNEFIPVFDEMKSSIKALKKSYKEKWVHVKGKLDKISDEEATKLADDYIILQQQIFDIKKRYHARFKAILPPQKLLDLYKGKAKKEKKKK